MAAKKKPTAKQLAARAKFTAMVKAKAKARKAKAPAKKVAKKMASHKDTKSHNVKIHVVSGIGDAVRKNLEYGAVYDTALQLYLVKFANLSFSLWAVTGDGLRKALNHPEGKNQAPIVYRVKSWGTPKFEKLKLSEIKAFK